MRVLVLEFIPTPLSWLPWLPNLGGGKTGLGGGTLGNLGLKGLKSFGLDMALSRRPGDPLSLGLGGALSLGLDGAPLSLGLGGALSLGLGGALSLGLAGGRSLEPPENDLSLGLNGTRSRGLGGSLSLGLGGALFRGLGGFSYASKAELILLFSGWSGGRLLSGGGLSEPWLSVRLQVNDNNKCVKDPYTNKSTASIIPHHSNYLFMY